jgi:tetratricopeptide (TPR) repeat protein
MIWRRRSRAPYVRSARHHSGFLYTERHERARETFGEALEINGKYLPALFGLAQAHLAGGNAASARQRLEELLGLWQGGEDPIISQARQLLSTLPR